MSHLAVARRLPSGIAHGRDWRGLRRLLSEGDTDETAGTHGGARAWRQRGPGPGPSTDGAATSHDRARSWRLRGRSEEHTSELQSRLHLVCRLLLEKKKK